MVSVRYWDALFCHIVPSKMQFFSLNNARAECDLHGIMILLIHESSIEARDSVIVVHELCL